MARLPEVPDLRNFSDELIAYALCALDERRLYAVFQRTSELYRSGEGPAAVRRAEERADRTVVGRRRRREPDDDDATDAFADFMAALIRGSKRR